jgi:hypothetical protein
MEHTAACKRISKLYQGSRSVLDYFSEISQVCKITPKDYFIDLTFPPEIITEGVGAAADVIIQDNAVNFILDAYKQALKR